MKEYVQIITTIDTKESAEEIAKELVKNRLAACVQIIGPITSVYWWEKKVENATEWLCIAKTRKDLYKTAESTIHQNHTYEIPEILVIPITEGSEDYISWMSKELRK